MNKPYELNGFVQSTVYIFQKFVYESISSANSLQEIEQYVMKMIK